MGTASGRGDVDLVLQGLGSIHHGGVILVEVLAAGEGVARISRLGLL